MTKISRRLLARTAVKLLREKPDKYKAIVRSLAAYVVVSRQTNRADLLLNDIAREAWLQEGTLFAQVQSARTLSDTSRAALKKYLQRTTGARHVELAETVQPELLSGVIIRTADQQLDTTARRALQKLASLTRGT